MTSLTQINWTDEYTGAGVLLGNIDGWPALDHPDIAGKVTIAKVASNASFAPFSWQADHSTGCAGIALGEKYGVAPGAKLVNTPCYTSADKFVFYDAFRTYFLRMAYDELLRRGVKCVNREISWSRSPWGMEAIWGWNDMELVSRYTQFVHVQAAGNQGLPIASQAWSGPASAFDHLLIVGAVDAKNKIATFSNTPQNRGLFASGDKVIKPENFLKNFFVCAPGVGVQFPGSPADFLYGNGTSYAAPFVEGLVALMYEKAMKLGKTLSPQECARIIKATCKKIGPPEIYGHGLIDVKAALAAIT